MARDQSVWSEGEVDTSRAEGSQLGLEEVVGVGEEVVGAEPRQTVEDDIGGRVQARSGEREDVGFGSVRVEWETEEEEEDNASEEDVQGPAWGSREGSGRWTTCDGDSQTSIGINKAWEEDGTEEYEDCLLYTSDAADEMD